jgi:hypothetical protein
VKILANREYTEDGMRYVFRDIEEDDGTRKTQHLVMEPWGEEFWEDSEPADREIDGARAYDQTEHQLERARAVDKKPIDPEKPKAKAKK